MLEAPTQVPLHLRTAPVQTRPQVIDDFAPSEQINPLDLSQGGLLIDIEACSFWNKGLFIGHSRRVNCG